MLTIAQGVSFSDMHRLHLPSMTWRPGLQCHGGASTSTIAGHCLVGGLEFGGCMATILGVLPISKLDLMLLMPGACFPGLEDWQHMSTGAAGGAAGAGAEGTSMQEAPFALQGPRQVRVVHSGCAHQRLSAVRACGAAHGRCRHGRGGVAGYADGGAALGDAV